MANSSKYALVTGASSGIGRCISLELAARDFSIVAVSNQENELASLKNELKANGIQCITFNCNLASTEAPFQVFKFCEERDLDIEILVNNAGILVHGEVINLESHKAAAILQLHMYTPAMLCKLFGEKMAKAGHGHILNVSSISAVMPYPTISLYGPTKTFLRKFSLALRTELKPLNVNVTCLIPGATVTALYDPEKVNLPLATKLGIMKSPDFVAKIGVKAMFKRKRESIPGWMNRVIMVLVRFVPNFVIGWIHRKVNR